ncbi:MAG: glycerate kinase [Myxococcota bacterium]|jgi:glycerate kinase
MILFAPDSYGGFLTAPEAVALAESALPGLVGHPMADGGEGSLEALAWHRPLRQRMVTVTGPYGEPVDATIGEHDGGSFIASAQACGLRLTTRRSPLLATTYGVGQLLGAASGPIRIGLGGSATIDCGMGMLQALGLALRDRQGRPLPAPITAGQLRDVHSLTGTLPPLPPIAVLVDVAGPLEDAVSVYGVQKGLQPSEFEGHAAALRHTAALLNRWRIEQGWPALPVDLPGGGAAGGLGFALAAVGGTLWWGAATFAEVTGLADAIQRADAVVIGEGRLDATSYRGKVAGVVSQLARSAGKPLLAVVGVAADAPLPPTGPDRIIEINGMNRAAFQAAFRRL